MLDQRRLKMLRNTYPSTTATTEAIMTAILAHVITAASSKARSVMNRETVKPIPARNPTPITCRQLTLGGSSAATECTAQAVNAVTPITFPSTRPTATPSPARLVNAPENELALIETRRSRMRKSARRLGSLLDALRVATELRAARSRRKTLPSPLMLPPRFRGCQRACRLGAAFARHP